MFAIYSPDRLKKNLKNGKTERHKRGKTGKREIKKKNGKLEERKLVKIDRKIDGNVV